MKSDLRARLEIPEAILTRSDLAELGYARRAIDIIVKNVTQDGSGVQLLPGYARPLILVKDFLKFRDEHMYRDDRVRP